MYYEKQTNVFITVITQMQIGCASKPLAESLARQNPQNNTSRFSRFLPGPLPFTELLSQGDNIRDRIIRRAISDRGPERENLEQSFQVEPRR